MILQGLDKGVLFSTYNLLISQSTSMKKVRAALDANPLQLNNTASHHTDIHSKKEHAEKVCGEMEFGKYLPPVPNAQFELDSFL